MEQTTEHVNPDDQGPGSITITIGPLSYAVPLSAIKDVEENIEHEMVMLPEGKPTMLKDMCGSYVLSLEDVNISQMAWLVSKKRLADMQYQPLEQVVILTVTQV